jgi:hypothetical protein
MDKFINKSIHFFFLKNDNSMKGKRLVRPLTSSLHSPVNFFLLMSSLIFSGTPAKDERV